MSKNDGKHGCKINKNNSETRIYFNLISVYIKKTDI